MNGNSHPGQESVVASITKPTQVDYVSARQNAAQAQLVKAAVRLADLLNATDWK